MYIYIYILFFKQSNVPNVAGGTIWLPDNVKLSSLSEQDTTLADLLQLNLHCFEEEVRGIVDRAVKEMGMEKVLSELNSTWTGGRILTSIVIPPALYP